MQLVDLSQAIHSGMQIYPGDPRVSVQAALTHATHGVLVSALQLGSHTGTHLDAPRHSFAAGRSILEIPLDELTGPALVLQLPGLKPDELVSWERLHSQVPQQVPRIVLLATGWDRHHGTELYLQHPVLQAQAAAELRQRGMRILGVDTLSPDVTVNTEQEQQFAVHEIVLGSDGLIVENLRGLQALPQHCHVGFFPLPLAEGDGAPVRAVAWVPTDRPTDAD